MKFAGVVVLIGVAGMFAFMLLGWAWYAWGAFGALAFSFAVILLVAWLYDRKQIKDYEDLQAQP